MYPQRQRGNIRPKVSTMPRQQSEAGQYLDIYKLTVEKKRLAQELAGIEQRRQQILTRMESLEKMVDTLEGKAHQLRAADQQDQAKSTSPPVDQADSKTQDSYDTLCLEY